VPNGGWLDGCLGVIAGYTVLRRIAEEYKGKPPVTVRLVDWRMRRVRALGAAFSDRRPLPARKPSTRIVDARMREASGLKMR